jgi:hypothetical protein
MSKPISSDYNLVGNMNKLTLEFSNSEDMQLVLSVAKRLNAHIVSSIFKDKAHLSENNRISLLKSNVV